MAVFDLDHVGIAVRDLDAAAATYRRLGFALTEKSHHVASEAGGPPRRTGTGNHCFIFEQGYAELIAATTPDYSGSLLSALDRYEGLHLIALGTKPAEQAASILTRTSGKPVEPRRVQRPFTERGRPFTAEFAILDLPDGAAPEAQLFGIQHLTPEAIWQPHLLAHPNGAKALASVLVCVPDPAEFVSRVARLFATEADGNVVRLARGTIEAVEAAGFAARFPGQAPPAIPSVGAMTMVSSDLARTGRHLASEGIPSAPADGRLWVPGDVACGAVIEFRGG